MGNKEKYEKLDALVLRAMKGDKKSFEKLCKIEAPQIIYSCTKLMGNTLDGEDAAQEVFISMQRRLPTLKTPEAFVSWIQKMIYYVCVNMRRKNMNSVSTLPIEEFADLFSETDSGFLPEEYINEREKSKELMDIIDNLPVQIRSCILMHYFSEMKISEITTVMGISEGSVKGYLYVGREKIRKALKASGQESGLHSAAPLPMAALGSLFRQEMQILISPAMVNHCLSSAGISSLSYGSITSLPLIKNIAIAASCTLLAAGAISAYHYSVSNPAPTAKASSAYQQSLPAQTGEDKEIEAIEPTTPALNPPPIEPATPPISLAPIEPALEGPASQPMQQAASSATSSAAASLPSSSSSQALLPPSSSTSPSTPVLVPPPSLAAVATKVEGNLAIKNAENINNLSQLFGKQYYATIEQGGKQFALTTLDSEGKFSFDNLFIAESGTYTLHIKNIYSSSLAFSADNPKGTVEINLKPGQAYKLAQPLWVVEEEAPIVAVSILGEDGNQNPINPASIQIDAYDDAEMTIYWKIQGAKSDEVLKQGSSSQINRDILKELEEGYYIIFINVSDAFGNETIVQGAFYAGKS